MSEHDEWLENWRIDMKVREFAKRLGDERKEANRAKVDVARRSSRKKTGPNKDRRIKEFAEKMVTLAETEPVLVFDAVKRKKDLARLMHERLGFHSAEAAEKFLTRRLPTWQKTIKDKLAIR